MISISLITELTGPDEDNDYLTDEEEAIYGTNVSNPDTDTDGLLDGVEVKLYKTNPLNNDSDLDGLLDGLEIEIGTDPNNWDTDGDGKSDGEEYYNNGDPLKKFELDRIFGLYLLPVYILPFIVVGVAFTVKRVRKKREDKHIKAEIDEVFHSGYSFSFEAEEQAIREETRAETIDDN